MKARELKKLNKEFIEFLESIDERTSVDLRGVIAEFWFAKFGCNNEERENELYEYFINA